MTDREAKLRAIMCKLDRAGSAACRMNANLFHRSIDLLEHGGTPDAGDRIAERACADAFALVHAALKLMHEALMYEVDYEWTEWDDSSAIEYDDRETMDAIARLWSGKMYRDVA